MTKKKIKVSKKAPTKKVVKPEPLFNTVKRSGKPVENKNMGAAEDLNSILGNLSRSRTVVPHSTDSPKHINDGDNYDEVVKAGRLQDGDFYPTVTISDASGEFLTPERIGILTALIEEGEQHEVLLKKHHFEHDQKIEEFISLEDLQKAAQEAMMEKINYGMDPLTISGPVVTGHQAKKEVLGYPSIHREQILETKIYEQRTLDNSAKFELRFQVAQTNLLRAKREYLLAVKDLNKIYEAQGLSALILKEEL